MPIKEQLYQICQEDINRRLAQCEQQIKALKNSLAAETKSSAGDKHETGRAMIQLEREQIGQQYAHLEKEKQLLDRIALNCKCQTIQNGNLVITSLHRYYLAISIGKIILEGETYFALSAQSPIGQLLIGKKGGDKVKFRNQEFEILEFF